MYRNDPIITGAPPYRPSPGAENNLIRAAYIWDYLDKAGVPDVRGVAYYQTRLLVVVAIKQRYPGHAKQAALIASQCRAAALLTRYVVVVDEDIDIWDSNELLWALCTRTDPVKDIEILRRCWSNPIDPIIPPSERGFQSRGIIDACRPYEWMQRVSRGVGGQRRAEGESHQEVRREPGGKRKLEQHRKERDGRAVNWNSEYLPQRIAKGAAEEISNYPNLAYLRVLGESKSSFSNITWPAVKSFSNQQSQREISNEARKVFDENEIMATSGGSLAILILVSPAFVTPKM